jgi:Flp pilus assembly protein TadG
MMCIAAVCTMLRARLNSWLRDKHGTSAIEFALLTPVMLVIYFGSVQIGDAVAINRKVTIATRTVANLTTLYSTVSPTTMSNIMSTTSTVVAPYTLSNIVVTVSEVTTFDTLGDATVTWSQSLNGTAYTPGTLVILPVAGMAPAIGVSLIWCQVQYNYTPTLGYMMTGTFPIRDQIYMSPRISSSITYTSS